jgi:hypothetical protein
MAITPNPVTAFRKSGKTPPKPPKLEDYYKTLYGENAPKTPKPTTKEPTKSFVSQKPKTTTIEEQQKLFTGTRTVQQRIRSSETLTPKQKQELIAEADRIAAGERRQVSTGGPTPSLFKKLQDVAYSKILSPFKSSLQNCDYGWWRHFYSSPKARLGLGCLVGLLSLPTDLVSQ